MVQRLLAVTGTPERDLSSQAIPRLAEAPGPGWARVRLALEASVAPDLRSDAPDPVAAAALEPLTGAAWLEDARALAAIDAERLQAGAGLRPPGAHSGRLGPAPDVLAAVEARLGGTPEGPLSSTSLTALANCPFQGLSRKVLGLEPPDDGTEELDARGRGQFLHEALEQLVKRLLALGLTGADPATLPDDLVPTAIEAAAREHARCAPTGHPRLWALAQARARTTLERLLRSGKLYPFTGMRPAAAEERFGPDLELPAALPGERPVYFRGTLDRIDRGEGGTGVLDYKSSKRRDRARAEVLVTDFQLPLYLLALRARGERPPFQAGWLSLRTMEFLPLDPDRTGPLETFLATDAATRTFSTAPNLASRHPRPARRAAAGTVPRAAARVRLLPPRLGLPHLRAARAAGRGGMSGLRPNACVFAGAGTGKTHGLITECLRLLGGADRDEPLPPARLCLLTFTEKAAAEMRGRLAARVAALAAGEAAEPELSAAFASAGHAFPPASEWRRVQGRLSGATIATFHGFCAGLLRRAPAGSGIPPDFVLLDEEESLDLLEELAERLVLERLEARDPATEALCGELDLRGLRRTGLVELLVDQARRLRDHGHSPDQLAVTGAGDVARAFTETGARARSTVEHALGRARQERAECEPVLAAIADLLVGWGPDTAVDRAARLADLRDALPGRGGKNGLGTAVRAARDALTGGDSPLGAAALMLARPHEETWRSLLVELARRQRAAFDEAGVVDFAELLIRARDLLATGQSFRAREQSRIGALLLDEFQDTNVLQLELTFLLAEARDGRRARLARTAREGSRSSPAFCARWATGSSPSTTSGAPTWRSSRSWPAPWNPEEASRRAPSARPEARQPRSSSPSPPATAQPSRSPHQLLWVKRVCDDAQRPAVELARHQDLLDEVGEAVRLLGDHLEEIVLGLCGNWGSPQGQGRAVQRGERRPESCESSPRIVSGGPQSAVVVASRKA